MPHAALRSSRIATALLSVALALAPSLRAQDPAPTAADLSSRLAAAIQDGSSTVRLKLETRPSPNGPKSAIQVAVKSRRSATSTDLVYQILWPKERKGEAFLLRRSDTRPATGAVFTPPDSLRPLSASSLQEAVFGTDLAYEDLLDNFFAWEQHSLVGTEVVDRIPCHILESKPGKGTRSTYARVRSWIDTKKLVPMRIEKYLPSGELERRIDTTRVAKDDTGRPVAASFSVRRPGQGSLTELEGSNSRHDITLTDADFTPEALRPAAPRPQ